MKVSIIGGAGFIGSRLCKRFNSTGIEFEIVDKNLSKSFPKKTKIADVRSYQKLLDQISGSIIINLAAEHKDDVSPKSLYADVNINGAKRICEVAEKKEINKIIFTSSVAVYGFAPVGTDESGDINFFNEYGRTKYQAELVYKEWQAKDPENRSLIIVRPTVVFGEQNRGNVYNLLKQISSGNFIMIGKGLNRKSMAYVENVAAFLEFSIKFNSGVHIYNYVDKPDLDMNSLVLNVNKALGKKPKIGIKLPYSIGFAAGKVFDFFSVVTGKKLSVSSIRVKKFCSDTAFGTNLEKTGFVRPWSLEEGINNTIKYEFIGQIKGEVFYSE